MNWRLPAHIQRFNPQEPLSTALYVHEPTIEFATRLAKILARKTKLPAYVGNSMSFANAGLGGTVEEEAEAFKTIVATVMDKLQGALGTPTPATTNDTAKS